MTKNRISGALAAAGVTQSALAARLGLSQGQVSQRIRGAIEWRLSELRVVAEMTSTPVAELVGEPEPDAQQTIAKAVGA